MKLRFVILFILIKYLGVIKRFFICTRISEPPARILASSRFFWIIDTASSIVVGVNSVKLGRTLVVIFQNLPEYFPNNWKFVRTYI